MVDRLPARAAHPPGSGECRGLLDGPAVSGGAAARVAGAGADERAAAHRSARDGGGGTDGEARLDAAALVDADDVYAAVCSHPDFHEGIAAFLEHRRPRWSTP
ncbi:MAG: hypothetical protein PGN11_07075 [Quadrisphaera sp.]